MPQVPFAPDTHLTIRAPVVDEFSAAAEGLNVTITPARLSRIAANMTAREARGEYSPLVIGHTTDSGPETDQPPLVGWMSGPWEVGEYEGRKAIFANHHVARATTLVVQGVPQRLTAQEIVARWPRRSAEIHLSRDEIDPHCLLGPTTPARPLGVLKLSSTSGVIVPRELPLTPEAPPTVIPPTTPPTAPAAAPAADSGAFAQMQAVLSALVQQVVKIGTAVEQLTQALSAPPEGAAAGAGHDDDDTLPDDLFDDADDETPAPAKKPKEAETPEDDDVAKLSRRVQELEADKLRLSYKQTLATFGAGQERDEALLNDLVAMPKDMAERHLQRLRLQRTNPEGVTNAVISAASHTPGPRALTASEVQQVVAHAQKTKVSYEAARKDVFGF